MKCSRNSEERGIMDSSAELSLALARVWPGSVMRDGAAALSLSSSHCSQEETFNISAGLTHCVTAVWRAVGSRLFTPIPAICEYASFHTAWHLCASWQVGREERLFCLLESFIPQLTPVDGRGHQVQPFICWLETWINLKFFRSKFLLINGRSGWRVFIVQIQSRFYFLFQLHKVKSPHIVIIVRWTWRLGFPEFRAMTSAFLHPTNKTTKFPVIIYIANNHFGSI